MTALKPAETNAVIPVANISRYPLNERCAAPGCDKPTESAHHIWPRSFLKDDSWFVSVMGVKGGYGKEGGALAHVIGLCGSGTTGHHGDLEEHRAWVKLEDGIFVWYERCKPGDCDSCAPEDNCDGTIDGSGWRLLGELNPQPGSREGRPKRKKRASTPEERKARVNYSIRTPQGEENILPELMPHAQEAFQKALGGNELPLPYVTTVAALKEFVEAHG